METVAEVFNTIAQARQVVLDLVTSGIPLEMIGIVVVPASDQSAATSETANFVASLANTHAIDIPDLGHTTVAGPLAALFAHNHAQLGDAPFPAALVAAGIEQNHAMDYAERVRQGGALVAVQADEPRLGVVRGVFHHYNVLQADNAGDLGMPLDPTSERLEPGTSTDVTPEPEVPTKEADAPVSTSIGALTSSTIPGTYGPATEIIENPLAPDDAKGQ